MSHTACKMSCRYLNEVAIIHSCIFIFKTFVYMTLAKSSAVYSFHYRSTPIHGRGSLHAKNLRECACLEDDLLEIKYTNQCINNVRQTCVRLLLFNKNVSLFVKNDFIIANDSADNTPHLARNCVESIHWASTVLFHRSGHCQGKIQRNFRHSFVAYR